MISVAVIGKESSGKTLLLESMKKYSMFEFEEHSLDEDNEKHFDFYVFMVQADSDVPKQLEEINTKIENCLVVMIKSDNVPYIQNEQTLIDKRIFYICNESILYEKVVFDLLFYIFEKWWAANKKELEVCKNLLEEWGYYNKLSADEQNKTLCMYYWYLYTETEKKNLIFKFVNKMAINNEELLAILPFRESYISQSQNVKDILKKAIQREHIPTCIPSFYKRCEEDNY